MSPAGSRRIPAAIAILVMVTIGDGTLVFHAGMVGFNKFIAIFIEGIWTKPMFKGF
ncbi:hypothetical protein D3C72_2342360 [compost metagenome]